MAAGNVSRDECLGHHAELTRWLQRIEDKLDKTLAGQAANRERLAKIESAAETRKGLVVLLLGVAGLVGGAVSWLLGLVGIVKH